MSRPGTKTHLVLVLALVWGCSGPAAGGSGDASDASESSDAGGEASSDARCTLSMPYSSLTPACNACAEQRCCAEVNACTGAATCNDDYVNCIIGCAIDAPDGGDAGGVVKDCTNGCGAMFPRGEALYSAATGCVSAACPKECK